MAGKIDIPGLELGASISVGVAQARGVSEKRLRKRDLQRPFWGVRSAVTADDHVERAHQYAPRLKRHHVFCGVTAALIWGLPMPARFRQGRPLEVGVQHDTWAPRTAGVVGRHFDIAQLRPRLVDGLPVMDPVQTFASLASALQLDELIVIADAIVSRADNYPGGWAPRPLATVAQLQEAVLRRYRTPGVGRLRAALDEVTEGVESPMETPMRLLLTRAGMTFSVNPPIQLESGRLVRPDLANVPRRLAAEFDGDGHRTDRAQWQHDHDRDERMRAAGWQVFRVTAAGLAASPRDPNSFLRRVERAYRSTPPSV